MEARVMAAIEQRLTVALKAADDPHGSTTSW
jgi:hypothetical protein